MNCTKENCCGSLLPQGSDCRQEWTEEYLTCEECGAEYTIRTDFKTQSHLIHSQVLYNESGEVIE